MPEKRGIPAKPCAIPIVKGFKIAPAKPNPAAIKTIHTPVMESYPIDIAIGTKTRQKAMVSSLIPNTAPNILKSSMMAVNKKLSMPILRSAFEIFMPVFTVVHDPECTTDDEDEDDDIRLVHKSFIKGGEYLPCLRYAFHGFIYNGSLSVRADTFRILPTGNNPCQYGAK